LRLHFILRDLSRLALTLSALLGVTEIGSRLISQCHQSGHDIGMIGCDVLRTADVLDNVEQHRVRF